jgi:CO/xanthine dehydrogenase FAD-binding subunit
MKEGITKVEHLISLVEVPDLDRIQTNNGWDIGFIVTLNAIRAASK